MTIIKDEYNQRDKGIMLILYDFRIKLIKKL